MIVAIDGPAASGKGTLARRIAVHFGLAHLDTGLLYRAVARDVLGLGGALDDEAVAAGAARNLDPQSLDDPSLRDPGLGEAASNVIRRSGDGLRVSIDLGRSDKNEAVRVLKEVIGELGGGTPTAS